MMSSNSLQVRVDKENKMPDVLFKHQIRNPEVVKNQIGIITKGLQEVNNKTNNQGAVPRKPSNPSNESIKVCKPFVRTKFSIYADDSHKITDIKKINKSGKLKEHAKNIAAPKMKIKETADEKSQRKGSLSSAKIILEDPVLTSQPNVLKIKELHRKVSIKKKTPTLCFDILPQELAYNVDYMCDFMRYQHELDERMKFSPYFRLSGVTGDQRSLTIKYLINSTIYPKYPSFILCQAVMIFDAYINNATDIIVGNELKILALAAFWIALKKDITTGAIPDASSIIEHAPTVFQGDKRLLIEHEKKILTLLNFEINYVDPFSIIALYTVLIDEVQKLNSTKIQELYYCASYLIDLSMLDEKLSKIPIMYIASISIEIALAVIMTENCSNPQWSHWRNQILTANPLLDSYCYTEEKMNNIRYLLLDRIILSQDISTHFHVVFEKYNTTRYGLISNLIVKKIGLLSA